MQEPPDKVLSGMPSSTRTIPSSLGSDAQVCPLSAKAASIFLPKEHGSWSLALEPLVLGLLVAPSWAGSAVAIAAMAGFFARRPLKAICKPGAGIRQQGCWPALIILSLLGAVGIWESGTISNFTALWPLLLALPLGGFFLYYDFQNESRAAAAELIGSSTFTLVPVTIATLAGWSAPEALALSLIALTRNMPTVLTVRTFLRQSKGQYANQYLPLVSASILAGVIFVLCLLKVAPMGALVAAIALLARTVWLLSSHRPHWSAKRVGQLEAGIGLLYIGGIAAAYHLT